MANADSERAKMLRGDLYNAADLNLVARRQRARRLTDRLNASGVDDEALRLQIIAELFGKMGQRVWVEPPFYCDYGENITLGSDVFFNFNCVVLDVAPVTIGDFVLFGPNVQIYTATHPIDTATRRTLLEAGKPIHIGSDVWIGGSVVILPGVSIGSRSVVGAGSVVTRDVPDGVFAARNPCRVIRELE